MSEEYMDIYSRPGTKIKFDAGGGWEDDKEKAKQVLTVGSIYTVSSIDVRSSHSYVHLEEVSGGFNTVMFKKVKQQKKPPKEKDTIASMLDFSKAIKSFKKV